MKSADEYDYLTGWRRFYRNPHRSGVIKRVKNMYRRRMRRIQKEELKQELNQLND